MRSAISERPISTPSGTPTLTATKLPSRNALPVIHSASAKLAVGTISTMRRKMVESGGMMKLAPVRPKISHSAAQMMSEQNMGMRTETPKMLRVMTATSIQVLLEALPDLIDGVDLKPVAADGTRVVAAWDVRRDAL